MSLMPAVKDYGYRDAEHTCSHRYVLPTVERILARRQCGSARALDFGCGNGAMANRLSQNGFDVAGIDPSASGIAQASQAYPDIEFHQAGSDDDLAFLSAFDLVTCIEVIEHCYDPRSVVKKIHHSLKPGGLAILSTPYHGYLKNIALAISGKVDQHFAVLRGGGHIKFFAIATLSTLLAEAGFVSYKFCCIGRIPTLAKRMIAAAEKGCPVEPRVFDER